MAARTQFETAVNKARESRIRRLAQRQGYAVVKSRRRNERASDFGAFWLVEPENNVIVGGHSDWGWSLDQIEAWLLDEDLVGA